MIWLIPGMIIVSLVAFFTSILLLVNFNLNHEYINTFLYGVHNNLPILTSYLITLALGYSLAVHYELPKPQLAFISVFGVFLSSNMLAVNEQLLYTFRFFNSILAPFLIAYIVNITYKRAPIMFVKVNLYGSNLRDTINLIIPGSIALIVITFISSILLYVFQTFPHPEIILDPVNAPLFTSILLSSLNSFLWFFGIHGYYAILPLFDQLVASDPASHITPAFLGTFVFIGGSGATFSLILAILLLSKNSLHRKIAIISLPLAAIGVNEILLFCLPIILNYRFAFPFLTAPLVNATIAHLAISLNWIEPNLVFNQLHSLFIFNAWLIGDNNGLILQLLLLTLGAIIYAPFVILHNRNEIHSGINIPQLNIKFDEKIDRMTLIEEDPINITMARNKKIDQLKNDLNKLKKNKFMMFYQPKVHSLTGEVIGCEALIRATSQDGQLLSPATFLPIFKEANLTGYIDIWVAQQVVEQIKNWLDSNMNPPAVSINISPKTLENPEDFTQVLNTIIGLEKWIRIEITEETLAIDNKTTKQTMKTLKESGFKIDIDDFGTGYSSLSYLNSFDADAIKIDRSFVNRLECEKNQRVLRSLVKFLTTLDVEIIVEGVETEQQMHYLTQYCHCAIQGWYFSKALCPEDYIQFVKNQRSNQTSINTAS